MPLKLTNLTSVWSHIVHGTFFFSWCYIYWWPMDRFLDCISAHIRYTAQHHMYTHVFCAQGSEQSAADTGLSDGGGHAGPEEPETLGGGARSQLVWALSQLSAGKAAGALPHTHLHTHPGEIRAGKKESPGRIYNSHLLEILVSCLRVLQNLSKGTMTWMFSMLVIVLLKIIFIYSRCIITGTKYIVKANWLSANCLSLSRQGLTSPVTVCSPKVQMIFLFWQWSNYGASKETRTVCFSQVFCCQQKSSLTQLTENQVALNESL